MAKWGEGDPRWLVESREDGSNVNRWHWEEINKLTWARSKLTELLIGYEHQNGTCKITKLKDISGDVCTFLTIILKFTIIHILLGLCLSKERK